MLCSIFSMPMEETSSTRMSRAFRIGAFTCADRIIEPTTTRRVSPRGISDHG